MCEVMLSYYTAVTVSCAGFKNFTQTVIVKELTVSWLDVVLEEEEGGPEGAMQPGGNASAGATLLEMGMHQTPKDPRPLLNGAAQRHERTEGRGEGSLLRPQRRGRGLHLLGLHLQTYKATMIVLFSGLALVLVLFWIRKRTRHRTSPFRSKKLGAGSR